MSYKMPVELKILCRATIITRARALYAMSSWGVYDNTIFIITLDNGKLMTITDLTLPKQLPYLCTFEHYLNPVLKLVVFVQIFSSAHIAQMSFSNKFFKNLTQMFT